MTSKYIMVGSYAEAEGLGIKPVDSIISVSGQAIFFEKKTKPPYRVVGFAQGYSFKSGEVEIANTMTYVAHSAPVGDRIEIHAINDKIARMVANEIFGAGRYTMDKRLYRRVV